jgi:hypothetical protein
MNHRNRALLDLAHRVHVCMNCGDHVLHGCEPAHENGVVAGKGFGIKSHDHRHAALCHRCHVWYDQGGRESPCGVWTVKEKPQMFIRAHMKTFDYYWSQGWLKVAA